MELGKHHNKLFGELLKSRRRFYLHWNLDLRIENTLHKPKFDSKDLELEFFHILNAFRLKFILLNTTLKI